MKIIPATVISQRKWWKGYYKGGEGSGSWEAPGQPRFAWEGQELTSKDIRSIVSSLKVSEDELDDIQNNFQAGTDSLNDALRRGLPLDKMEEGEERVVTILDRLFEEGAPLKADTIFYRTVQEPDFIPDPGKYFIDEAFVSTSSDLKAHQDVMEEFKDWGAAEQYSVEIRVPKGIAVVPLQGELCRVPQFAYQKEVLLRRGTTFLVESKSESKIVLRVVEE